MKVNNRLSRIIRNMPQMRTTKPAESLPVYDESESESDDPFYGKFILNGKFDRKLEIPSLYVLNYKKKLEYQYGCVWLILRVT